MKLVYGCDQEVAAWVAERIPHLGATGFGPCTAIGVMTDTGRASAGVVYHDYHAEFETIQLSMAADTSVWGRPGIVRALLAYPFLHLGVFKLWTITPRDNEAALKVNRHIGFVREAVLGDVFGPNRHGVVCRMRKPDFQRKYGVENG